MSVCFYHIANYLTVGNNFRITVNNGMYISFISFIYVMITLFFSISGINVIQPRNPAIPAPSSFSATLKFLLQTVIMLILIVSLVVITLLPAYVYHFYFNYTKIGSLFGFLFTNIVHYIMIINTIITIAKIKEGFNGFRPLHGNIY